MVLMMSVVMVCLSLKGLLIVIIKFFIWVFFEFVILIVLMLLVLICKIVMFIFGLEFIKVVI